jgi:formate dehydrogenase maturation protein FdhE
VREQPAPSNRADSREIAELRRLKDSQPDLASAAKLQIELLQLQRRVQSRVALPSIKLDAAYLKDLLANGGPILQFEHIAVDWSDMRFLLRSIASVMRTHDALEEADSRRAEMLSRDSVRLASVARIWYESARSGGPSLGEEAGLENVILQAMRPFLTRAADAIMARSDFAGWTRGTCPLCGGEPDLAVITPAADRLLICGRCAARWRFAQLTCPFCLNADRRRITSFASRDGQYRLYACDVCQRYLKAYDARHATRPVMPAVDSVATLPLDAAAIQRGYK